MQAEQSPYFSRAIRLKKLLKMRLNVLCSPPRKMLLNRKDPIVILKSKRVHLINTDLEFTPFRFKEACLQSLAAKNYFQNIDCGWIRNRLSVVSNVRVTNIIVQ